MLIDKEDGDGSNPTKIVDDSMVDAFLDVIDQQLFESVVIDTEEATVTISDGDMMITVSPTQKFAHARLKLVVTHKNTEEYNQNGLTVKQAKEKTYAYTENMLELNN